MARWIVFDENTASALASRHIEAELHTGNALQAAIEFGGSSIVLWPAESGETLVLSITPPAAGPTGSGLLGL